MPRLHLTLTSPRLTHRLTARGGADLRGDLRGGPAMPRLMVVIAPTHLFVWVVSGASLAFLALLGAIAAQAGGASAPGASAAIGVGFGTVV